MAKKIDHQKVQDYSISYTQALLDQFFSGSKDSISGAEIKELSSLKQINFFILKAIFTFWQEEVKKLESPYFDYRHQESQSALQGFMNTLSRHINVNQKDIRPLVITAVQNSLYLLLSPFEFFYAEFSQLNSNSVELSFLEKELKYIKINRKLLQEIVTTLRNKGLSAVDKSLLIDMLEKVLMNEGIVESPEQYLEQLSILKPVSPNEFFIQEVISEAPTKQNELQEEKPVITGSSAIADAANQEAQSALKVDEEVVIPEKNDNEPNVDSLEEIEKDLDIAPLEETPKKDTKSLNDNFKTEQVSLNDKLKKEEEKPLAEALEDQNNPETLLNTMSINHGYMFINELFNGNADEFNLAMERLETCENFDAAVGLLIQKYARPFNWDMNSKEVKELLKMIFRRFR